MFNIDKQQVLDAFRHRRATRAYDPSKKISPDDFAYILELARLSPSSIGSEPWQFLVVQNAELRGRLKPVSWGMASQVDDCSHLVVILAKKNARWDSAFLRAGLEKRGLDEEGMQRALAVYEKFQKHDMKTRALRLVLQADLHRLRQHDERRGNDRHRLLPDRGFRL